MVNCLWFSQVDKDYCYYEFKINDTISAPIYVYYELDNFYSNHKDYVKSKNFAQLRGENVDVYEYFKTGWEFKKVWNSCALYQSNI